MLPIPSRDAGALRVPARRPAERGAARRAGRAAAQPCSVLVVDDDERMLRSYVRLLNPLHRLLIAQDGGDAIELLELGSLPDVVLFSSTYQGSTAASS